ncbi:MAG: sugar MFS transporter [Bacteroidetes bacterium]|nr:sugar MFS transporter [Bacteroidota bacterium]
MNQSNQQKMMLSLTLMGALFFIFGFVTWLNGILIPYLQIACDLTNFQAVFVTFSFYISYTLMAVPSSKILEKTGFKSGIMIGLLIMAVGTLMFIPAAVYRTFSIFLAGLFVMGTGLALMQTAVNPYITILGRRETAAVRLSIMGICNNFAGAIGPLILAYYILNDGDAIVSSLKTMDEASELNVLNELSRRVIGPYIVMTAVLVVVGILVKMSPLPELDKEPEEESGVTDATKTNIFQFPHLILGVITLFFYVGVEVIAGNTIFSYGISLGIAIESAQAYTTMVMFTMLAGYVLGILAIPRLVTYHTVLKISAITGILFTLAAIAVPSSWSFILPWVDIEMPITILFVALLGLSNSLIWPAIWPLAIHNLGKFIKTGSALMIMAIAGGAVLPLLWGWISDSWSAREAYWIVVPAYLIILFYALYGYKVKTWKWKEKM